VLDYTTPDSLAPHTRQSSVYQTVHCMIRPTACSREFWSTSAIIHRTVREEHQTVWCASRQRLAAMTAEGQRSSGAPDSLVPPSDGLMPPRTGNKPTT
jgi:hypothetical protein